MSGDEGLDPGCLIASSDWASFHNTLACVCVCSTHAGPSTYDGFSACF